MADVRTYIAVGTQKRFVRKVQLVETYKGSAHWHLSIWPEGYGTDPEPMQFGVSDGAGGLEVEEGYGIFRIEHAVGLAKALTGAFTYEEDDENKPEDWTHAQWVSLRQVCRHQNAPFRPKDWVMHYSEGGYIMNKEPINGMHIGIEKDGHAHT